MLKKFKDFVLFYFLLEKDFIKIIIPIKNRMGEKYIKNKFGRYAFSSGSIASAITIITIPISILSALFILRCVYIQKYRKLKPK